MSAPKVRPELPDPMLSGPEVAVLLGIHRNTVSRMIARGDLAAVRVSARGDLRVAQSELDRFLRANRVAVRRME